MTAIATLSSCSYQVHRRVAGSWSLSCRRSSSSFHRVQPYYRARGRDQSAMGVVQPNCPNQEACACDRSRTPDVSKANRRTLLPTHLSIGDEVVAVTACKFTGYDEKRWTASLSRDWRKVEPRRASRHSSLPHLSPRSCDPS